jgi:hypothetical protein
MKKKISFGFPSPTPRPGPHKPISDVHRSPEQDLFLYAEAFHKGAKALAAAFRAEGNPLAAFDASAVVFMYRHVLELHMKGIVLGEGGNFLGTKPDHISISKTHSVSWLAQFVCQIITALQWEKEFRCEGVETLDDFKAVIDEVNTVDSGYYTFRLPVDPQSKSSVGEFSRRMDALIGLLASTGDALAAEWDLRTESDTGPEPDNGGFGPMIQ